MDLAIQILKLLTALVSLLGAVATAPPTARRSARKRTGRKRKR